MSISSYYLQVAGPVLIVLIIGLLFCLAFRRASAASRQFVAVSTLCCCVALSVIPWLPLDLRPSFPVTVDTTFFPIRKPDVSAFADLPSLTSINQPSQLRLDLALYVEVCLGTISLALVLRLMASCRLVARLRDQSQDASARLSALTNRRVRVVEGLSSPAAFGGLKPVILLPAEAEHWPEDQLRAILIHEEAHLDNGDPTWQFIAELVCAVHWFNPLTWIVRNIFRSSAERAADDQVIQAGIRPSTYAQDLAMFASRIGKSRQPIGWTTFIRKESFKGRIQAILNQNTQRNPMKKSLKFTSIIGLTLAAYVTSAYVRHDTTNPQSSNADIRNGKTVAARASNNYVGQLADHRNVEIVQISRQMPNGSVVAWRPDGTPLSPAETITHRYHPLKTLDTHTRYLVFRFPVLTGKGEIPNAGCGSGGSFSGEPSSMIFAGGGNLRQKDGFQYVVSYIGLPKEDADKFSVGVSISDSTWTTAWKLDRGNTNIRDFSFEDVDGPAQGDAGYEKWWTANKSHMTKLEFVLPGSSVIEEEQRILPILKSGAVHLDKNEIGNFGGYIQKPPYNEIQGFRIRYYFAYKKDDIKELIFQTRASLGCEVYDLASNPKKGP